GAQATRWGSSTRMRSPGRSWESRRAADRPANPAPMTTQSALCLPSRIRGAGGAGSSSYQPEPRISLGTRRALRTPMAEISRGSQSGENRRYRPRSSPAPSRSNSDDILRCPPAGFAFDDRNLRLQGAYRLFQLAFLRLIQPAHRLADGTRRQAGKLAPELDALNELSALLQDVHQRQQGRHDLATLLEILVENTGVVEREMLLRQAVAGTAHPALRPPSEELEGLIIHAAEEI